MTLTQALTILREHNKWRRGADIEMIDPKTLGEAIDVVCNLIEAMRNKGE